jgi:Tfp pilus assembly protein PilE
MKGSTIRRARRDERGFACLQSELMIVIAITGILAAIAIPKFATLIRKSQEGATRRSLSAIRSGLGAYHEDMKGEFPADLAALTGAGKYLAKLPEAKGSVWSGY